MLLKRRVVVTGMGAITPLGVGVGESWQSLCLGKSGVDAITSFDVSSFRTRIAGEVKGFNPLDFIDRKLVRRGDRFIHFAFASARMALEDSGLVIDASNSERVGVSVGTAMGGIESIEKNHELLIKGARQQISPFFVPSFLCNMATGQVAIEFGARGANMCSVTACASGTHAIGDACRAIQWGEVDAMIAGGAEAAIRPLVFAGLEPVKVMTARNDKPAKASRPFDKDRDGLVMGEGAGVVILETLEHAQQRGADPLAEITGYGSSADAFRITDMHPEGLGPAAAILQALEGAGLDPRSVDERGRPLVHYISAHGTGTQENDAVETLALKAVFGDNAAKIPVSSIKSMMGHLIAAAGAVELITCILAIRDGILPPTINLTDPEPEFNLDYVPNAARPADVEVCLSDSFGFGGQNDTLVVQKFKP